MPAHGEDGTSAVAPIRVLTVGDGDLSFSRALARCLGAALQLTATTLVSEAELIATYSSAAECLQELAERGVAVQHNVDAMRIHDAVPCIGLQEHIIFNYPYLGLSGYVDEADHSRRHGILMAHYFNSARDFLVPNGCLHVTLSGDQDYAWDVRAHAERNGLTFVGEMDVTSSDGFLHTIGGSQFVCGPTQSSWAARRKFRTGALGSPHWLWRYGYEHRRCEGMGIMHVNNSKTLIFKRGNSEHGTSPISSDVELERKDISGEWPCSVCSNTFNSEEDLQRHLPGVVLDGVNKWRCESTGREFESEHALKRFQQQQQQKHLQQVDPQEWQQQFRFAAGVEIAPGCEKLVPEFAPLRGTRDDIRHGTAIVEKLHDVANAEDCKSLRMQCATATGLAQLQHVVGAEGAGQRAKQFARQVAFSNQLRTKQLCEQAFKESRVLLNGIPVEPTRILHEGDVLELYHDSQAAVRSFATNPQCMLVEMREIGPDLVVAWKPAGMRACGEHPGTLQAAVQALLPPPVSIDGVDNLRLAVPVSRIEIGCPGLSVLARTRRALLQLEDLDTRGRLFHSFVALVHGRVPDAWKETCVLYVNADKTSHAHLPIKLEAHKHDTGTASIESFATEARGEAEDKRSAKLFSEQALLVGDPLLDQDCALDAEDIPDHTDINVSVHALSITTSDSPVALSTVRLEFGSKRGRLSGILCYALRTAGFAVVGDRYARRENAKLPKYCASLKSKLNIGCYGLHAELDPPLSALKVDEEIPQRMMASHWEEIVASKANSAGLG